MNLFGEDTVFTKKTEEDDKVKIVKSINNIF